MLDCVRDAWRNENGTAAAQAEEGTIDVADAVTRGNIEHFFRVRIHDGRRDAGCIVVHRLCDTVGAVIPADYFALRPGAERRNLSVFRREHAAATGQHFHERTIKSRLSSKARKAV